jgi:hypothetical protein
MTRICPSCLGPCGIDDWWRYVLDRGLADAKPASDNPNKSRRQKLYKEFIEEASKLYADALGHNEAEVSAFVKVYALISRMRVLSSVEIVEKAEKVVRMIFDTYFAPNKTLTELRGLLNSPAIDPLRDFSESCRKEPQILSSPAW